LEFGICNLGIIPLRKEPNHKSELISEILYGETFTITQASIDWIKISLSWDDYEGWINKNQFQILSFNDFKKVNTENPKYVTNLFEYISLENSQLFPICIGSNVSASKFLNHNHKWIESRSNTSTRELIIKTTFRYLHTPYLWGGKSPFGIDCSGLAQMVYKINGIKIKRDAWQQAEQGITLSFIDESEQGDLAFFDDEEGGIIHVGILLKNNRIIHSHGKVRVDKIDQTGIFNSEKNTYSHKLRIIKKIF
tara:strand:- start:697 stop:1449 length:753 start_codon:yes stop_codon:yes gene_type:complete